MHYLLNDVPEAELSFLVANGFSQVGNGWLFTKNGKTYDLSAADITQISRIEALGLFLVK